MNESAYRPTTSAHIDNDEFQSKLNKMNFIQMNYKSDTSFNSNGLKSGGEELSNSGVLDSEVDETIAKEIISDEKFQENIFTPTKSKHAKNFITPELKLEIVNLWKSGQSVKMLSKKYNVGMNTIRDWKKPEMYMKIEELANQNKFNPVKRKSNRGPTYPELDQALADWIIEQRAMNKLVTNESLIDKAKELKESLYKDVGVPFVASKGWLEKFWRRNGFKFLGIKTENNYSSTSDLEIPSFIKDLCVDEETSEDRETF